MLNWMYRGLVPPKPHTALRLDDGALCYEHCLTTAGFDGPYSILYHQHRPHAFSVLPTERQWPTPVPEAAPGSLIERRHFPPVGGRPGGDSIDSRQPLLFNDDLIIARATPSLSDRHYFSNADADELLYIHSGTGCLLSPFGRLAFEKQTYLFIPKGVLHRFELDTAEPQNWLVLELSGGLRIPGNFRNPVGQLRMDAPYSWRDFGVSEFKGPIDEGLREAFIKRGGRLHLVSYEHSPLDVVGFDGTLYPFTFPIRRFQPRVSSVHLPPNVHSTFEASGALICSFVPRPLDFGKEAIACPYPHSSVDIDEVLFYSEGDFTSRTGVTAGSLTWHPRGVPHGPHPGRYEQGQGQTETNELAVMLDCTNPLQATTMARLSQDPSYESSFTGPSPSNVA